MRSYQVLGRGLGFNLRNEVKGEPPLLSAIGAWVLCWSGVDTKKPALGWFVVLVFLISRQSADTRLVAGSQVLHYPTLNADRCHPC